MARRTKKPQEPQGPSVFEFLESLDQEGLPPPEATSVAVSAAPVTSPAPEILDLTSLSDRELYTLAWRTGSLEYLLRAYQVPVYRKIKKDLWGPGGYETPNGLQRRFCVEIHRRYGKSFLCGVLASELCISKPGARVIWAAETSVQVRRFLVPLMRTILTDCPDHMRPVWSGKEGTFTWPNGSEILIAGVEDEGKIDRLRGSGCDLFVIDEAGSIDLLDYLYRSVVLWMLATTDGRLLVPSTPARSPAHPFTTFCALAEAGDGGYARADVYGSGFTPSQITELAKECGGEDTPAWQREALALRVVDASRAVVPEFSEAGAELEIVQPFCLDCGRHYDQHADSACQFRWGVQVPEYRDLYVGIDFGWSPDLTAIVFGYWDFRAAQLVIEGEAQLAKPTTIQIADAILTQEAALWSGYWSTLPEDQRKPYRRVADVDLQILYDLERLHGVYVSATRKDDKEASLNDLRVRVKRRGIRIHPRCKRLISHLKAALWNPKRTSYLHMDGFGHLDFVDSLLYLHRNLDLASNPYPKAPQGYADHWARHPQAPVVPSQFQDLATQWSSSRSALFGGKSRNR